jgi:F-type H+-transporting ATPase subunit a
MGPHSTWYEFLPGYETLKHNLQIYLGRDWTWQVFRETHFELSHIFGGVLVLLFALYGAARYSAAVSQAGNAGLIPPPRFNLRNMFEMLADTVYGLMEGVMGPKEARRYLPVVGSLFLFILFSNLLGLIPGFLPPTGTMKTNLALAVLVFVLTHVYGVREHGIKYFRHFLGPWLPFAPIMLPIEIVSHIARPVSLTMRLVGNITADHKVAAVFFGIFPFILPVPFLVMGVFVSLVQAVVFSILSTIYISTAVAHEEH